LVDLLLHLGADINLVDDHDWPLLHQAAMNGHLDVCRVLISRGAVVNSRKHGELPMHMAAAEGHTHVLELLLDNDPLVHVDEKNGNGRSALTLAALFGNFGAAALLLARGADVNGTNCVADCRPLYAAAQQGHFRIVELLLNQPGIDVGRVSEAAGRTPLHDAINGWSFRLTSCLVSRGTDMAGLFQSRSLDLATPSYSACKCVACDQHVKTVRLLLEQPRIGINDTDMQGRTPLLMVAATGAYDLIALLLARGATASAQVVPGAVGLYQVEGWTALHVAAARGHLGAVTLLLSHPGVSANEHAVDHRTALHFAVMQDGFDVVVSLLDRGANID
ncbi:ankyrin repeat-containing domain protein, partial [Schizophyllum commune]